MDLEPPAAVSAEQTGANTARVLFDRPLEAGALDPANWSDNPIFAPQQATAAVASGSQVDLTFPAAPSNGIRYDPPPFDLTGANGLQVQQFLIPLT